MKKFFQAIGMITLICFSFIFTEKTATVLKQTDQLMVDIQNNSEQYLTSSIDAKIEDNTIVPGLYGKQVNEENSYSNMKKIGYFNDKKLVFDMVAPEVSVNNNYDKYIIGGNPKKNMVSLIFKVDKDDDINNIISIVNKYDAKVTFFVDGNWLEKNSELIASLINSGHTIGNMGYNGDYSNSSFIWMNTVISRIGKQKKNYCYLEEQNMDYLNICSMQKNHTIIPNIIVGDSPYNDIKSNLKAGSFIAMDVNNKIEKELDLIIQYIKSKGFIISNLESHISEK